MNTPTAFNVRVARADEFAHIGQLMIAVYSALAGFPSPIEQPRYYEMLANIGKITERPGVRLLVATEADRLLGAVVYFADMAEYGSGGSATQEQNASGFRLLAVNPAAQGYGVGAALIEHCIALARADGNSQLIIHSTAAMQTAWGMYERRGFVRSVDLDFMQELLQVFGFRLRLG
jgi:GNAT superfamily N-acetyltransferase